MIDINLITDEIKPFIESKNKISVEKNIEKKSKKGSSRSFIVLFIILLVLGGTGFGFYKFILPLILHRTSNVAENINMPSPSGIGVDKKKADNLINIDKKRDKNKFVDNVIKNNTDKSNLINKKSKHKKILEKRLAAKKKKRVSKNIGHAKVSHKIYRSVAVPTFLNYQYLEHKNPQNFLSAVSMFLDNSKIVKMNINGPRTAYIELSGKSNTLKSLLNKKGFSVNRRSSGEKYDIRFSDRSDVYKLMERHEYIGLKSKIYGILSQYGLSVSMLNKRNSANGGIVYSMNIKGNNIAVKKSINSLLDILSLYDGIGIGNFIYNNNKVNLNLNIYFN